MIESKLDSLLCARVKELRLGDPVKRLNSVVARVLTFALQQWGSPIGADAQFGRNLTLAAAKRRGLWDGICRHRASLNGGRGWFNVPAEDPFAGSRAAACRFGRILTRARL